MNPGNARRKAREIRLAVFDVDGVMTDGRLYLSDSGEEIKTFHTRDGLGLKALMRHDIEVAVITARTSRVVERRARELGIATLLQGCEDKADALAGLLGERGLAPESACYAGDDLLDWPAMRRCGLSYAPADANAWIRERVAVVTRCAGGCGAVREICEFLLDARGLLEPWQSGFE
ncbi:MAG: KdsC family phosphatase [Wenzhouxiangella sp.]